MYKVSRLLTRTVGEGNDGIFCEFGDSFRTHGAEKTFSLSDSYPAFPPHATADQLRDVVMQRAATVREWADSFVGFDSTVEMEVL